MAEDQFKVAHHAPGAQADVVNQPHDTPTIYVDGIGFLNMDPAVVKIGFIETSGTIAGQMTAKFVVKLAMNRANLDEFILRLTQARDALKDAQAKLVSKDKGVS